MKKIYSVYIENQKRKENKKITLLLEAVGCFILGFSLSGFMYLLRFY